MLPVFKTLLVAAVALLHIYILILEMFLWTKPKGMKTFRMTPEQAQSTAVLAANQGLYNGFLAAGLTWSLFLNDVEFSRAAAVFFLSCVFVAGIYGGYSVGKRIFFVQGIPALIALVVTLLV